jgi:hypothetical protein
MAASHKRPVYLPTNAFDNTAALDAAEVSRLAHSTAAALLDRAREDASGLSAERLVALVHDHGIDEIAELWSNAPARTLPGSLWRLYLIQLAIHNDAETAALLYERGRFELHTVDDAVAGAATPATAEEMVALIDTILRGAFRGDFAVALERAAAFCRVEASGAVHLAGDYEVTSPERAQAFTRRSLRLSDIADDLVASAALWRRESLG